MTARFERSKERRSLFERRYVLTLEVLRDGHVLRILVREMFIDKGLDVCEARTLRGPVAALPVNDFVVLAAASYADRLQLARLLHTQGEFIQRRLIQIAARVIGAANDPIQLQKDDRRSGRSALRSGRDGFGCGSGAAGAAEGVSGTAREVFRGADFFVFVIMIGQFLPCVSRVDRCKVYLHRIR